MKGAPSSGMDFVRSIEYLEAQDRSPGVAPITAALEAFDPDHVHAAWQKALDRRLSDPEGAITAAPIFLKPCASISLMKYRLVTPIMSICRELWALASEHLNLAPHQHQESVFKAILGNCQSVVNYLGSIRNQIGDTRRTGSTAS